MNLGEICVVADRGEISRLDATSNVHGDNQPRDTAILTTDLSQIETSSMILKLSVISDRS